MSCASVAEGVICFLEVWHSTSLPVWGNAGMEDDALNLSVSCAAPGHPALPYVCRCLVLLEKLRFPGNHICFRDKLEWMVKHLWILKIHPF